MRREMAGLLLAFAALAPALGAQTPDPEGWKLRPSLYAIGSIEEGTDLPFDDPSMNIGEASPAGNFGVGLDFAKEGSRTHVRGLALGLVRSPFSGADRSWFLGEQVEGTFDLGRHWRLSLADAAKIQLRPQVQVSDYWRNEVKLGAEWRAATGAAFGLQLSQRHRSLSELQRLSFTREAIGLNAFLPLGTQTSAQVGAELQRYRAITAEGRRLALSAEMGRFTRGRIATLRLEWFEPTHDQRLTEDVAGASGGQSEFGDISRGEFFESLVLAAGESWMTGDFFYLDPLASDSDEWDFGRRKQVVTAYVSRRVGARSKVEGFLRFAHKRGPNLLVPAGPEGGVFTENRTDLRGAFTYQLSPRFQALLQVSYLHNSSDRSDRLFTRTLVGLGLRWQF